MKRFLSLFLFAAVLIAALSGPVSAQRSNDAHKQALIAGAQKVYQQCLELSEKESFHGYCGLMTSMQLWQMGINTWKVTADGNKQFDTYSAMTKTSGGYYVKAYSAQDYSLEEALNLVTRNGAQDVYNLLVGFESTNTQEGAIYGHACVINAILDGTVYFMESYNTPYGEEGTVLRCSIREFVAYYSNWTVYEGLICFGTRQYADLCSTYGTDCFLRARFDTVLRSQPCVVGENDSVRLRDISAGERLRAKAIYTNPTGERFYRVEDGQNVGYVAAGAVYMFRLNAEDLVISDVDIPGRVKYGKDFTIGGTVYAQCGKVGAVEVMVTDTRGEIVLRERMDVDDYDCDLGILNDQLLFDLLGRGNYVLSVYADAAQMTLDGDDLCPQYVRTCLWEQSLQVGFSIFEPQIKDLTQTRQRDSYRDGWIWENGTWYLYSQGKPCTGWVRSTGVDYYLREDGSVTVGEATVDGTVRYFSDTGALCTGWVTTPDGLTYRTDEGIALAGLQTIDGVRYYFGDDGILVTKGRIRSGGEVYKIQSDGRAVEQTK